MSIRRAFAALLLCVSISGVSAAANIPPDWAGEPGTTMQEWTFTTDDPAPVPEQVENPRGMPTAQIAPGPHNSGYYDTHPAFGEAQGYWDLGSGGTITLTIPPNPVPYQAEEVWVEVVYYDDITQRPMVDVPGGTPAAAPEPPLLVMPTPPFGAWYAAVSTFTVEPGTALDTVVVTADSMGSVIDSVAVYTRSLNRVATIPGDANLDCKVSILDLIFIRNRIGQSASSGDNAMADLNVDGKVNILDLIFARNHIGDKCPGE